MNGVAFANVPRLVIVDLRMNYCINKYFTAEIDSNMFRRKISRYCASADKESRKLSCKASFECSRDIYQSFIKSLPTVKSCCELEYETHIDFPDYHFDPNSNYATIDAINIFHQRNIEFLPVLLHERFPMLKLYVVKNTPIRKISKKNFEKLYELVELYLQRTQIEMIKSDTFEDLIGLQSIWIGRCKVSVVRHNVNVMQC